MTRRADFAYRSVSQDPEISLRNRIRTVSAAAANVAVLRGSVCSVRLTSWQDASVTRSTIQIMNSSTLSPSTLGHSTGQRTSESQDSELTSSATQTSKILNQMKAELQEQKQRKQFLKELHAKRVQSLRKELDYLKATEWRYQPIDRYLDRSQRN